MREVTHEPVVDVTRFAGEPLAIVGAGPSYSERVAKTLIDADPGVHIFALNHAITELFRHPLTWWVSNDHDRTFGNSNIKAGIVPRLRRYTQWRTITQRLFIPGSFGSVEWIDDKGNLREPLKFRLPCPAGSHIAWYMGGGAQSEKYDGYVRNGHSVLELALEVATLWKFDPIVLFGCDMYMPTEETYYAEPFRWKDTPRKIVNGKMEKARHSIEEHRSRWSPEIFSFSRYWKDGPFRFVDHWDATSILELNAQRWV